MLETLTAIIDTVEANRRCANLARKGEPQLGKRGLYAVVSGSAAKEHRLASLRMLDQSDGDRDLLDVAARCGLPLATPAAATDEPVTTRILQPVIWRFGGEDAATIDESNLEHGEDRA